MAIIRKDTLTINAGVTKKGEPRPTTYPVEVHDCSGIDQDHVFSGQIDNVSPGPGAGSRARQDVQQPPDTIRYPDSTFRPHDMPSPKPPKAGGSN
jgi:hypothetical protein